MRAVQKTRQFFGADPHAHLCPKASIESKLLVVAQAKEPVVAILLVALHESFNDVAAEGMLVTREWWVHTARDRAIPLADSGAGSERECVFEGREALWCVVRRAGFVVVSLVSADWWVGARWVR